MVIPFAVYDLDPDDPRLQGRPLIGLLILALPILGVFVVMIAYVVMWGLGTSGRSASGEVAQLRFEACAEARAPIEARLADMGLTIASGSDTDTGFTLSVRLTGDAAVDAALPAVLSSPGALEVRGDRTILATNDDLTDASVRLDLFMVSYVLLRLEESAAQRIKRHVRADPSGRLELWIDGESAGWQSNQNPVAIGELEFSPEISDEQARMRAVAAWAVVLDHGPLPCPVAASLHVPSADAELP